jgi:hypothetical protein
LSTTKHIYIVLPWFLLAKALNQDMFSFSTGVQWDQAVDRLISEGSRFLSPGKITSTPGPPDPRSQELLQPVSGFQQLQPDFTWRKQWRRLPRISLQSPLWILSSPQIVRGCPPDRRRKQWWLECRMRRSPSPCIVASSHSPTPCSPGTCDGTHIYPVVVFPAAFPATSAQLERQSPPT